VDGVASQPHRPERDTCLNIVGLIFNTTFSWTVTEMLAVLDLHDKTVVNYMLGMVECNSK
jgi:hypothetical protein